MGDANADLAVSGDAAPTASRPGSGKVRFP
jgi:hypothetical protein